MGATWQYNIPVNLHTAAQHLSVCNDYSDCALELLFRHWIIAFLVMIKGGITDHQPEHWSTWDQCNHVAHALHGLIGERVRDCSSLCIIGNAKHVRWYFGWSLTHTVCKCNAEWQQRVATAITVYVSIWTWAVILSKIKMISELLNLVESKSKYHFDALVWWIFTMLSSNSKLLQNIQYIA